MTVERTRAFLRSIDLPDRDPGTPPASRKRFPDGAQYRVLVDGEAVATVTEGESSGGMGGPGGGYRDGGF